MENEKYFCPKCGFEMKSEYDKPALILTCQKCNCSIATTKWEEIDLDNTNYEIKIDVIPKPNIEQIKLISNMLGKNYMHSKNLLETGNIVFVDVARKTLENKKKLDCCRIKYSITPDFKY